VPLSYEISVNPCKEADSIQIYEDNPPNYVVKLVLADVLNREPIDVKFRSAVLVGPSSFDRVPDNATVPDKWPEEAAPWLAATWCVDAKHERIEGIAKEIRDGTDDVMEIISRVEQRAKKIFRSADGHVRNLTAVEALDKRGSCTSCGNLVAALLRASDVPARVLAGYPSWSGPLQTHYIVEAYVPQYGWYPIESTRCQSPWPNSYQVNVAIIPTEYEQQGRAQRRCWAAGGVPYLSLTETPGNPGYVAFRGTIEDGRNCDHQCKFLRKFEAQQADWEKAIQWSKPRWKQWLTADHSLSGDGKLSFSKTGDQINATSLAELVAELQLQ
jgi:transglutaminase-like putative cysteine protease